AGTRFGGDTFVGENGASNFYAFVGNNGAAGPTNNFTGGGSFGWDTAIFPDARSNYSIGAQQADGSITVTNIDPQHKHAGSLTLKGVQPIAGVNVPSVQALAFAPTKSLQLNGGLLEATGDTLYLVGPTYASGLSPPASVNTTVKIEDSARLEI